MLLMTIELLYIISRSTLLGSPASWIMSFLTTYLACDEFTGMKRVLVSSLWRDLTMYLVLMEAESVGFAMFSSVDLARCVPTYSLCLRLSEKPGLCPTPPWNY